MPRGTQKPRRCFATFSGDLALHADVWPMPELDVVGPDGKRTMPLNDLYIGYAKHDGLREGDGKNYMSLQKGEFVTSVRAKNTPGLRSPTINPYTKVYRISVGWRALAGGALRRDGGTGRGGTRGSATTKPRLVVEGTADLAVALLMTRCCRSG